MAVPEYRQCVCEPRSKCFQREKNDQISLKVSATKSKHLKSLLGPAQSVCVFVCVLNCQASRVDHPTDEEQGTRRVIPDQVKKGPVDSVGQVSWCRAEAWILVPLRCHLHDNLVVETGEFNGLTGDLLQLCVQ